MSILWLIIDIKADRRKLGVVWRSNLVRCRGLKGAGSECRPFLIEVNLISKNQVKEGVSTSLGLMEESYKKKIMVIEIHFQI